MALQRRSSVNSEGKEGKGRRVGKGGGASPSVPLLQLGAELCRKKALGYMRRKRERWAGEEAEPEQ